MALVCEVVTSSPCHLMNPSMALTDQGPELSSRFPTGLTEIDKSNQLVSVISE